MYIRHLIWLVFYQFTGTVLKVMLRTYILWAALLNNHGKDVPISRSRFLL